MIIVWDKSGSMYRLKGRIRMDVQDLERLNQIVADLLYNGYTNSLDNNRGDRILLNKITEPLLTDWNIVRLVSFGLDTQTTDWPKNVTRQSINELLPPLTDPADTYHEQSTYYRKAFVQAHDLASELLAQKKYIMTVSDEGESDHIKDPDIERRYDKLIKTYPLVYHMLIRGIVELRVYLIEEPLPTPSQTPLPTYTEKPTSSNTPRPTATQSPTPTQQPTTTPTPYDLNGLVLKDENGKPVTRLILEKRKKNKSPIMMCDRRLKWLIPEHIEALPDETGVKFHQGSNLIIEMQEDGYFQIQCDIRSFNANRSSKSMVFSIPYINQNGEKTLHSLSVNYYPESWLSDLVIWGIIIITLGLLVVASLLYFKAREIATVRINATSPRLTNETHVLQEGEKIRFGSSDDDRVVDLDCTECVITFYQGRLRFTNESTMEKKRLLWNRKQVLKLESCKGTAGENKIEVRATKKKQLFASKSGKSKSKRGNL